jgi:hypothetical protein
MRGRHRRTDANQAAIVRAFRALGWSVQDISLIGRGCPDLLCGRNGRNLLVEVKQPKADLTDDERQWHASWLGAVIVIRSVEDVASLTAELARVA